MQKSKQAKINEKFRSDYLAVNIRETDIYEEGRTEGIALGISQGAEQAKIETARKLLKEELPIEQVARCTSLSMNTVEQLAKEQTIM